MGIPHSKIPLIPYPGGKWYGKTHILPHFPKHMTEMMSPFLGGASIELYCASLGIQVYASDKYSELVNFWKHAKEDPVKLHDAIISQLPMTKERFLGYRANYWNCDDMFTRAVWFYISIRSSYGAMGVVIGSGSYRDANCPSGREMYGQKTMDILKNFYAPNLHVEQLDFEDALDKRPSVFAYLDPPYYKTKQSYYGKNGNLHKKFDHELLAEKLQNRDNWVLSYDNHPVILDMYKDFEIIDAKWNYTMKNNFGITGGNTELIIKNVKTNKLQF